MNEEQIAKDWDYGNACIRKPKMQEACDLIQSLCLEVKKLKKALELEKRKQDDVALRNKNMLIEIQKTMKKYEHPDLIKKD